MSKLSIGMPFAFISRMYWYSLVVPDTRRDRLIGVCLVAASEVQSSRNTLTWKKTTHQTSISLPFATPARVCNV